jgi:predicted phosphodiesterase
MLQQFRCFDHHAVLAESAKRRLLFNPGSLYGVDGLCGGGF